MDGLEAAALIRTQERATGRHIPIVAMTAHAIKGDCERCLEAGMDGYTTKPIDAEELFAEIDRQVARFSLLPATELPVAEPAQVLPPSPAESMVDWALAKKAVRGDVNLLELIVETASGEIPQLLASIRRAVSAGDAQALRLAAHTLKGSIRYFGAAPVLETAQQLETMGQNNQLETAAQSLAALEQSAAELMCALKERILKVDSAEAVEAGELQSPGSGPFFGENG
jgi:two-component system, sensor histidine kinase and response regulator